jgi:hypothetical protein
MSANEPDRERPSAAGGAELVTTLWLLAALVGVFLLAVWTFGMMYAN